MIDLVGLKAFADFGGVFILAMVIVVGLSRKLDVMNVRLEKILTLLSVVVKANTNFNGVENVLDGDGDAVVKRLMDAESKELPKGDGAGSA